MNGSGSIDRDRLSVLTGALVLGLALARFLETPIRSLGGTVLGSQLELTASATTLTLLFMTGMAITAAESLIRSHPLARQGQLGRSFHFWIAPGMLVLALTGWLADIESVSVWVAGLVVGAVCIPVALAAEYAAVDRGAGQDRRWRWVRLAITLLAGALLFIRIYELGARTLLSGSAVFAVAGLLATRLFWYQADSPRDAALYGSVVGLLLAQLTWAVNYWPLSSTQGGLILLLAFYVIGGLIQQTILGRFDRQVVLEYLAVTVAGLAIALLAVG